MAITLAPTNGNGRQLPDRTHLGDRMEIAAIRNRLASMMQLPPDVPDDVIWAAAQLAAAHRLDPFIGEIYIIPTGKRKNADDVWVEQYRAHVGVKGLRTVARRQANFVTELTVMDADEVKAHRRDLYDPNDIGVRCTLWRLDVARECKDAGIPYRPVVGVGFWRQKAQFVKRSSEWMADNIPNTWSAQQVAEKRAEINAIKQAFDLTLDIADPATFDDDATIDAVQTRIDHYEMDTALPVSRGGDVDEDGLFYVVTPPSVAAVEEAEPEGKFEAAAEADDAPLGDDNPFDDAAPAEPDYRAMAPRLTGNAAALVDWAKSKHAGSDGPATAKQYRFLAGTLDSLTGVRDSHGTILGVLIGRHTDGDNPPGFALAKSLLDKIVAERIGTVDGERVKVPSTTYRQDVVDTLLEIWRAAQAA